MLASGKHKYSKTLAFPDTYYELIINLLQSVELFCAYVKTQFKVCQKPPKNNPLYHMNSIADLPPKYNLIYSALIQLLLSGKYTITCGCILWEMICPDRSSPIRQPFYCIYSYWNHLAEHWLRNTWHQAPQKWTLPYSRSYHWHNRCRPSST